MNREFFINQLINIATEKGFEIDREIMGKVVDNAIFRVVPKGSLLQSMGENTDKFALILNGICRAYYVDGDGNDITRGFAPTGTLCMDDGLFSYTESICNWDTLSETTLMIFEVKKIKELVFQNDQLKNMYIILLENAMRYKIYRESGFLIENATERYIHFKKLYPEICKTVKQHYIATYLGITPESLSRIRKALKESWNNPLKVVTWKN